MQQVSFLKAWLAQIFCYGLIISLGNGLQISDSWAAGLQDVSAKVDSSFKRFDINRDGVITHDEVRRRPLFHVIDINGDKRVTRSELEEYYRDTLMQRHIGRDPSSSRSDLYANDAALRSKGSSNLQWYEIEHQGYQRFFAVGASQVVEVSGDRPLLVSIHGHHGDPQKHAYLLQFQKACDAGPGCVVVYPAACKETAIPGDPCKGGLDARWQKSPSHDPKVDDPGFIEKVVRQMLSKPEYRVDPNAVYVSGTSNGGALVYYLFCSEVYPFRKYSSYVGNPHGKSCHPASPVSFYHIHGDEDVVVPFKWNLMDIVARRNRCQRPARRVSTEKSAFGGAEIANYEYPCAPRAQLKVSLIKGAGHAANLDEANTYKRLVLREFFGQ